MSRKSKILVLFLTMLMLFSLSVPVFAGNDSVDLKVGSRGEPVAELQRLLKKAGFFNYDRITGYYGWITYNAVAAMEKKHGLTVDGVVGSRELSVLKGLQPKVVMGYYTRDYPGDRLSHNALLNAGQSIDYVAIFDFTVDYQGNLIGQASLEGIECAAGRGARTLMVIHNIKDGAIERWTAYSAISPQYRGLFIKNIMTLVNKYGYDGVNIDLEGIPPAGRENFNIFLRELNNQLDKSGKMLTVAVPAKTADNPKDSWSGAYDYRAIGAFADYTVLMTYDEHWPGGGPGPVASLPWVTRVLDYAVKEIPSETILMGIAAYGYDWPQGKKGRAVKWSNAPVPYAGVLWDNISSSPYQVYWKDGVRHEVWFENSYSLAIKLGLLRSYNLGGMAFWRLGFEDKSFWDTLDRLL